VDDGVGALCCPQHQIVELGPVVGRTQSAELVDQPAPHHEDMRQIWVGQEKIGRPVRLEGRPVAHALLVDTIFVGVEHVRVRAVVDGLSQTTQSGRWSASWASRKTT